MRMNSPTITMSFYQIFPTVETFTTEWNKSIFKQYTDDKGVKQDTLTSENLTVIYELLYGRYAENTTVSDNLVKFKSQLFGIIYNYGPVWQAKLKTQRELMNLTVKDLQLGSTVVQNHATNPETAPQINSDGLLSYIDQQSAQIVKKSPIEGYANLIALLDADVTEEFLNKFKKLFNKFINKSFEYDSPNYMSIWS